MASLHSKSPDCNCFAVFYAFASAIALVSIHALQVHHKNVCKVVGFTQDNPGVILLQYCSGGDITGLFHQAMLERYHRALVKVFSYEVSSTQEGHYKKVYRAQGLSTVHGAVSIRRRCQ